MPERFPAEQPFTARQYLTAMGRMSGLSAAAVPVAVDRWVDRLGLAPYRDVPLPRLSKGTGQKVGLAQALLAPPGLLVLDEPWERLDAAQARELVPELVAEVLEAGGSVLVNDHRGEAARLPGARRWLVAERTVRIEEPPEGGGVAVVEVVVPAARAASTVAALRAAGYARSPIDEPGERPGAGVPYRCAGGGAMTALLSMRLAAFVRTGRALAPLLAGLPIARVALLTAQAVIWTTAGLAGYAALRRRRA